MFAVTVEDPEMEPEPQIELKIHPSLLLKVRYFYAANCKDVFKTCINIFSKLGVINQDKTAD